jgi:hypothetical protein
MGSKASKYLLGIFQIVYNVFKHCEWFFKKKITFKCILLRGLHNLGNSCTSPSNLSMLLAFKN